MGCGQMQSNANWKKRECGGNMETWRQDYRECLGVEIPWRYHNKNWNNDKSGRDTKGGELSNMWDQVMCPT